MNNATSKTNSATALESASFMPESWSLPDHADLLESQLSSQSGADLEGVFMLKPDGGQSGIGIQVCTSMGDVMSYWRDHEESAVVQRYIEPQLYDGVKWDLRLYVLVASLDPVSVYVARPAWCGLCAETWQSPLESTDEKCHVASGNKKVRMEFSDMLAWMQREKATAEESIWAQIDHLVAESIGPLVPDLESEYTQIMGPRGARCMEGFQILGLDLMFDSKGKVWLAEINTNPDMGAKTDVDLKVKHEVLQGALDIVCDGVCPHSYARVL